MTNVRPRHLSIPLLALFALGCPGNKPAAISPRTPPPAVVEVARKGPVVWKVSKSGLGFRISDADDDGERTPPKPAVTTPLSEADTARLLARLPPLAEEPLAQPFALREKSPPAPRTGQTIKDAFPPPIPPQTQPVVAAGPLKVLRYAPEGDVGLAPYLSVTFSAPMVPITSHAELAKVPVPVQLSPKPPGEWRWIGTQTVVFQPDPRFPMATDYAAEIPAGTKGARGETLAAPVRFGFKTPTPKLLHGFPRSGPIGLTPIFFAELDQAIDEKAAFAKLSVTANGKPVAIRPATRDEAEEDPQIASLIEHAKKGRWLAWKAEQPLPPAASVVSTIAKGFVGAEGPKPTPEDQSFDFHTYHPFQLTYSSCGSCTPLSSLHLSFNNAFDRKSFEPGSVTVAPEIAGMKVTVQGSGLVVSGKTKGRTKYKVTVAQRTRDVFGQTLVKEETATLDIGRAMPALFAEESDMTVLDPAAKGKLPVFSVNDPALKVRIYQATPADFPRYHKFRDDWDQDRKITTPPGKLVFDRVVRPAGQPDELTETGIDLANALDKAGIGQAILIVETLRPQRDKWSKEWVRVWVQSTRIGLHAMTEPEGLTAWATELETGRPLGDVDLFLHEGKSGKTGADGLGRIEGTGAFLWARKDGDVSIVAGRYSDGRINFPYRQGETASFYIVDDRRTYKPGEEAHLKGWVRHVSYDKNGDVKPLARVAGRKVTWAMRDARGAEAAKGEAVADDGGGFDFVVKIPKTPNLGSAYVSITLDGVGSTDHAISIQEFRRPEFEVTASASGGPHFVGESAIVTTAAKYYAGGGLPNAEVSWSVNRSDGSFTPPNHAGWSFGKNDHDYNPYRWWGRYGHGHGYPVERANRTSETWKGRTDPQGAHRIKLDFEALTPPYPMVLSIHGSVTDVNRQQWSANTSLLVHPASVYVGLKPERHFIREGEAVGIDTLVSDLDGKLVPGRKVTLTLARLDWEQKGEEYEEKELDRETCEHASREEPSRCTLKTKHGGRHKVVAVVEDEHGRKSQTTLTLWVMGGSTTPDRDLKPGEAKLLSDKKQYAVGDTAEILVMAPFAPAEGIVTLRRGGLVRTERFTMKSTMQTVAVKLDETMLPGITAHVVLVGSSPREDDSGKPDPKLGQKPAFAQGSVALSVPPAVRTLSLSVTPREKRLDPGGSTTVGIDVKDAKGAPVPGGEVVVVVVDEAILALAGYKHPDPLATFYPGRAPAVEDFAQRDRVVLAKAKDATRELERDDRGAARNGHGPGGGGGVARAMKKAEISLADVSIMGAMSAPAQAMPAATATAAASASPAAKPDGKPAAEPTVPEGPKLAVRTDFSALAVFAPRLVTDARGHVDVPVKLPDSLTRYRVWAAAAEETRFGSQESTITARLPLMVRPSAPRFLNYGDRFELPVVLQNQTDKPMDVGFAARALNATIEGSGRKVTVPPDDRVEVRLLASAVKPGTARFQIGAVSGAASDASQIELPVWTPATTEAFATYGVIDQGAIAQRVKMPDGVVTQFGGLEVTTSSTALQALTDAVLYLVRYPYECNEQTASRVMAIAALKDVLGAFKAEGLPKPEALLATVAKDLDRLKTRQHWNGGWGFWFTEPWPYLSVHVTHTLVRAKEKGFKVDDQMLARAHQHLRVIEQHIPHWYGPDARRAIVAYAVYVRNRMKDPDPAKAKALIKEAGGVDKTGLETLGWLYPTLAADKGSQAEVAQIRRHLENRMTETAGAAHFTSGYGDGDHLLLHSDRRADGILLEGLIGDQPQSDIIPKLVTGLLGHRKAGRWASTQENAFVLLALDRYFAKYEGVTPDFVAKLWLGDRYAGEQAYKGRSTERHHVDVPMKLLADVKDADLVISKEGAGRLYYRVGMQYAPSDLKVPPMDRGFVVSRVYEAVDKPEEVKRDADGTWRVKAGAKVRVRVTMVAQARRYHVALVDPLPAGLEPMNSALAVTGPIPHDPADASPRNWWARSWYEHENMRDERVEAFASLLWEGVHEYVYVARATTPGTWVVPPPKAEEMYSPEVFGRGAGDKLVVE